ncbi:MAG TPA: hypothetical protein VKR56_12445 [Candidatus Cybelea sp.]|nr:hypothetical protein [Candidatus Cybelea sp.]
MKGLHCALLAVVALGGCGGSGAALPGGSARPPAPFASTVESGALKSVHAGGKLRVPWTNGEDRHVPLYWSADKLPKGATSKFKPNPTRGVPPNATTQTIRTALTTKPGTYTECVIVTSKYGKSGCGNYTFRVLPRRHKRT